MKKSSYEQCDDCGSKVEEIISLRSELEKVKLEKEGMRDCISAIFDPRSDCEEKENGFIVRYSFDYKSPLHERLLAALQSSGEGEVVTVAELDKANKAWEVIVNETENKAVERVKATISRAEQAEERVKELFDAAQEAINQTSRYRSMGFQYEAWFINLQSTLAKGKS